MATTKITDLTAYTDPVSTDVVPIVDVTSDVTKKVSIADLMENAGSGTEALPGISFDGDPNTGIYRPGADQVAISTNGTGRLFVDASGNVGVGSISTSSFQSASSTVLSLRDTATSNIASLKVLGGAGAGAIAEYGATNGIGFCGTSGAHDFTFYTNSDERLRITSTGELKHLGGGTEGSPAVYFAGSAPSNSLYVQAATGNVGIGTSSPSELLEVSADPVSIIKVTAGTAGSNTARRATLKLLAGGSKEFNITADASDASLKFLDSTTPRLTIDSSGRVGIGSTTVDNKLQVVGDIGIGDIGTSGTYDLYWAPNTAGGSVRWFRSESSAFSLGIGTTAGTTEQLRVDGSGRLLVGTNTTSAISKLVVQGATSGAGGGFSLQRSDTAVSAGSTIGFIQFTNSANNVGAALSADGDGTWSPGTSHPTRLVFSTTADGASSPTERMRITSAGKFKFSDSGAYISAAGTSHEFRNGSSNNIIRFSNTNATPYGNIIEYEGAAPNSTGQEFLVCQDSSASRFRFRSNGGLANYQSNDVNLCDEREKKNIEALDSTWGCLKNWELKKFHYNEDADTDDKRYGVIAQQVAPHCPEVITDWVKQKAEDAVLDEDGNVVTPAVEEVTRMGVKEQQMMWMAIKALQEAQTRIETLEAEVAALKGA